MALIIPIRLNETPQYACTICPKTFYADERHQYERHVLSHPIEDLVPHSPALQAPVLFGTAGGDREWAKWVEDHRQSDPGDWARWGRTDDGKSSSGLGDG